jgi:serine/threonine protein kinase
LSDVLAEENRLPLYWVVDILEQVCAAVHDAHQQGIVHRDLKPDNIWLEPNGLGGYRVKVLDFGIAKLGEVSTAAPLPRAMPQLSDEEAPTLTPASVSSGAIAATAAAVEPRRTMPPPPELEAATLIQNSQPDSESNGEAGEEAESATRIFQEARQTVGGRRTTMAPSSDASGLTRVGAILGTPLYMSPEQCRGERLDARSDIYSLGIIAYQMLSGSTPFTGDTNSIIRAHKDSPTPSIRDVNRKVPKRVAAVLMSALSKDPAARPQTALAMASSIRANADGLGTLYRRAFALYSEYFPEFLKLSLLAHIPTFIIILMTVGLRLADDHLSKGQTIAIGAPIVLFSVVSKFLTASIISGVTAIIVTQLAVMPMKPVRLRAAFQVLRQRWRPFLKTGILIGLRILLGWILFVVPGMVMTVRYLLWGPVVLMEGLEKKAARQRARALASRSWRTIILVTCIQFLVPIVVSSIIGGLVSVAVGGTQKQIQHSAKFKIGTQFIELVNIFVLPLMSIVPALLYLKMRQFGGETLTDIMNQFEEQGKQRNWQQRMRSRLTVTPQSRTPM